jgi:hypothetical protein
MVAVQMADKDMVDTLKMNFELTQSNLCAFAAID